MSRGMSFSVTGNRILIRKLIRSGARESVSFRLNLMIGLIEKAVRLFILYWFFKAILDSAGEIESVISYILIAILVESIVRMDLIEQMAQKIACGEASYWLIRPLSPLIPLFWYTLGRNLPTIVVASASLVIVVVLGPFSVYPISYLYFLISITLAYSISFNLQYLLGVFVFFTQNSWGIKLLHRACMYLLSGVMFPKELLPSALAEIIHALPFYHAVGTPVQVLRGNAGGSSIALQIVWAIVLLVSSKQIVARWSRRFVTVGG